MEFFIDDYFYALPDDYVEKEIFYKSKMSLTPKRKVASYVGRLCEEGSLSVGLSLCALWSM
ncbi:MAG: hypothetical protein IM571_09745 [Chitinophagaceae bacterium]|jgi:hypothetical protein|nr:hypothetical protein [Chitinophagaceae bacterium]MCA6478221.1 hypothetical protein [Chitinophagaceae bacterium]MCA6484724.1 hypothetical protein [Chitinophagaceae bacterium]MCA6492121.1 hypothetical protein [Chitinophagaceae bacterium]MCA6497471.1 hypothetical protein [Chitinophagaceae bacterium]